MRFFVIILAYLRRKVKYCHICFFFFTLKRKNETRFKKSIEIVFFVLLQLKQTGRRLKD